MAIERWLWAQKQDIGPSPRCYSAMAYDSRKQKSILFGGTMYDVKMFNDPWEQEPTGWTQVVDTGPSPRSRHSMIYDENRKKIVLFGGHSEGPVIDTWQLEDNVWKEKQDIGPSYPVYSEMVYSSNGIVLFGGTTFRPGALGANVGYI